MKIRITLVLAALVLVSGLAFPQCMGKFKQGITHVMAEASGGGGSSWQTDLFITDVSTTADRAPNDVEIWIWYYSTEAALRSKSMHFTVPAGGTVRVENVIAQLEAANPGLNLPGIYIGHINATNDVVANARIYNTASGRGEAKPGFGQGLPALEEGEGLKTGEYTRFPTPLDPTVARVNVGIANVGWGSATVTVTVKDDMGSQLSTQDVTLRDHEVKQVYVNGTVPVGYAAGYVEVKVKSAVGNAIYPYVSVVDNVPTGTGLPTSDPSFFYMTR